MPQSSMASATRDSDRPAHTMHTASCGITIVTEAGAPHSSH